MRDFAFWMLGIWVALNLLVIAHELDATHKEIALTRQAILGGIDVRGCR